MSDRKYKEQCECEVTNKDLINKDLNSKDLNNKELTKSDELLGEHSQIAQYLRAFYISIQEEQIPEKFLDLLERLDCAESRHCPVETGDVPLATTARK